MKFEEVLEGTYVLNVPFGIVWTGIVLIRGKKNILIDSSHEEPEIHLLPALAELGMRPADIDWLLNTHCHGDHIGGHHALVTKHGLKTAVCRAGVETLRDPAQVAIRIRTKFPEDSPPPQSYLKGVEPNLVLDEGEWLEDRFTPIMTPGHERDCVCWFDKVTQTIFSGDSLQANGTPTQGIGFYQSLPDYRQSLAKLKARADIENIVCGHEYAGMGAVVKGREAVAKALETCARCVKLYDERIAELRRAGATPVEIVDRLVAEVGCGKPEKRFLALYTVTEHLKNV